MLILPDSWMQGSAMTCRGNTAEEHIPRNRGPWRKRVKVLLRAKRWIALCNPCTSTPRKSRSFPPPKPPLVGGLDPGFDAVQTLSQSLVYAVVQCSNENFPCSHLFRGALRVAKRSGTLLQGASLCAAYCIRSLLTFHVAVYRINWDTG